MQTLMQPFSAVQSRTKLSDQIRRALELSHLTQHSVAKATGISEPLMSRFISGKNGLSMAYLDRLADYLQIDIRVAESSVLHSDRRR
jgi:transcriptional regulator with XRE-family HTH domain